MDTIVSSCCFPVAIFVVIGIGIAVAIHQQKEEAERAYRASLEALKSDPNNPDLRQKTLELGRTFSKLMRNSKGGTPFDELALMNDINAACARSPEIGVSKAASATIADQIEKLARLREEDIITDDEFNSAKANMIGKSPAHTQVDEAAKLLRHLHALYVEGALTESEYNMKKWDILSQRLIPKPHQAQLPRVETVYCPATYWAGEEKVFCGNCKKGFKTKDGSIPRIGSTFTCPNCGRPGRLES